MRHAPELVEVDSTRLEEVLRRVEQSLDEQDAAPVRAVFESYAYVSDLVEDKDTSIRRLRQLFFGARTEKTEAVVGQRPGTPDAASPTDAVAETGPAGDGGDADGSDAAASGGHGRNGAEAYRGATRIDVPHPSLRAGDACPACGQGTVYEKAPGVLVRITGQPPLAAKTYRLQKLRCHLCGRVFTAAAPEGAGDRKYDATAGSMIGLLKYGSGLPFNRLDGLQGDPGVPLPASTRWDIVQAVATSLAPAFDELIRQAAQGEVLHNDDTTVKILELMGGRARREALAGAATDASDSDERRGLYTSGVVALEASRNDFGVLAPVWDGRPGCPPSRQRAAVPHEVVPGCPPCTTVTAWPCSSADAATRARTWPRCSNTAPRSSPRRSRCVMPCRAIYRASSGRSWPTAWPTPGGSSSRCMIVSPSRAATSWNRSRWCIATTT